jgi:hypothetical protein
MINRTTHLPRLILCLSFLSLAFGMPAIAQAPISDDELYRMGLDGQRQGNCVTASRYWYAYLLREPKDLRAARKQRLQEIIKMCEQMAVRVAYTDAKIDGASDTKEFRCENYAATAVAQYQSSRSGACRFSGSRWSSNREAHHSWCLDVPESEADKEFRARDRELERCLRRAPP